MPDRTPTPAPDTIELRGSSNRLFVILFVAVIIGITAAVMVYVWRGRIAAQPGMLYVPEGTFLAGPNKKSTQLNAFFIDATEVTNAEFAEFCRETSASAAACGESASDLPVVNVTVAEARAFARWKGKRLPTALEWEKIARGVDGNRYPWGNDEDPTKANVADNPKLAAHARMPVKSFAALPAYQMAGNVWEMVEGEISPDAQASARFAKLLSPPPGAAEKWIEIRGGSFQTPLSSAVAYRGMPIPERYSAADIGFRCAKTP